MAGKVVTTTDELVKAAASKCPDARNTLVTLFPEVFKQGFEVGAKVYYPGGGIRGTVITMCTACGSGSNTESRFLTSIPEGYTAFVDICWSVHVVKTSKLEVREEDGA